MPYESATWLTENDLVGAVKEHLLATGWDIRQVSLTNQHGIDILAARGSETLAVEVKGGGSSKPETARYGKPFTRNQKRSHVAVAVLTALRETSRGDNKAAIALPDDREHVRLIEEIWPALRKLDVGVYLVAPDRAVRPYATGANA
jgi:hypothetical protein